MRFMEHVFLLVAFSFVLMMASSCSPDNDEAYRSQDIVGTWEEDLSIWEDLWDGMPTGELGRCLHSYLRFYKDGSVVWVDVYEKGTDKMRGEWKFSNNDRLCMKFEDSVPVYYDIIEVARKSIILSVLGTEAKLSRVSDSVIENYL